MKKIVSASLFIFCAIVTAIIATGLIFYRDDSIKPDPASLLPGGSGSLVLDIQEIAKHNLQSDCWMIIDSKVYNFTSYLGVHPGEASSMLPYCGRDGLQGFATKDKKKPQVHSSYAVSLLGNYYIGDLNQILDRLKVPAPSQLPAPSGDVPIPSSSVSSASPMTSDPNITLNTQEIAKHNTTGNCWIIINSKVYNVTSYLSAHPGGVGAIAPYCGKDAAQAFQGLPHSSYANNLLANYFIGDLNQTTAASQIQQNVQNTAQATPPPRRGGDSEDDD